jgi:Glyoxalase-like domain
VVKSGGTPAGTSPWRYKAIGLGASGKYRSVAKKTTLGDTMKIGSVVIDCDDFDVMSAFWAEALHHVPRDPVEDDWVILRDPEGTGVYVSLQRVPETASEKDRLHFRSVHDRSGKRGRTAELDPWHNGPLPTSQLRLTSDLAVVVSP